ncbi:MAG: hypothetical protein QOI87_2444 [Bradyrhizobium sp.]|jgi:hypothetical protein|nr:hypothetical protein [Bradyrhizobium sp.]
MTGSLTRCAGVMVLLTDGSVRAVVRVNPRFGRLENRPAPAVTF